MSGTIRVRRGWHGPQHATAIAVGNFDGVHLGHDKLLAALQEPAAGGSLSTLVMTFDPHPLAILDPNREPARLVDLRDKARFLGAKGVDQLNVVRFDKRLASMEAGDFVQALTTRLKMSAMVAGSDFRFGHGRKGDVEMLRLLSRMMGFGLTVVDDKLDGMERVSSKAIRGALGSGDFEKAERMLGRRYLLSGRVVHGDGMGRKLGWPTVNIRHPGIPPLNGIYAAWCHMQDKVWPAAASIGNRPTIGGKVTVVEAYLIGYRGNAYGQRVSLEPVRKLRDERNFKDLDELRLAIGEDVRNCESFLARASRPAAV